MVDAGVGGKVGIDHAGVKNLVGAFHHPLAVVTDPSVLATLPVTALRWGLAEAVKAAVVASPLLLEELERSPRDGRGIPAALPWVVEQAVRIKAAYVSADPFDRSVRASLNLGHTFAHAVESATGYGVPHGEAVAMGLVAAARLGAAVGATDGGLADRLRRVLAGLGLPVDPPQGLDPRSLLEAMGADKKRRSGRAAFVVPAPDGVELVEGLDPPSALAALIGEGRVAPVG
jgi:3-dehydroquinate synthetase